VSVTLIVDGSPGVANFLLNTYPSVDSADQGKDPEQPLDDNDRQTFALRRSSVFVYSMNLVNRE
jgi:hypothetical protein